MGAGLYTITTRAVGTVLTANIYNTDHQNHVNNQNTEMMDDYSTTVVQMQSLVDPFPSGSPSLPASLAGELERLRYQFLQILKAVKPSSTNWYEDIDIPFANRLARVAKSTDYTATTDDCIIEVTTGLVTLTITLPTVASAGAGKIYVIKKVDSDVSNLVIDAAGTELIDGSETKVLNKQYEFIVIENNTVGWSILGLYSLAPTIPDFTNAQHNHSNVVNGGGVSGLTLASFEAGVCNLGLINSLLNSLFVSVFTVLFIAF